VFSNVNDWGHPSELDLFSDGAISTVQGVRMWVANAPRPLTATTSQRYRVFYELNGQIYTGLLEKNGSPVFTKQANGVVVNYLTTLNSPAVHSIAAGLIVQGSAGDGAASAAIAGPTVDLIGIGASGVNGALAPADLRAHYNVPDDATGAGQTIAIVDELGTGNVLADLNAFSRYYNLPECNDAHPCFQQLSSPGDNNTPGTEPWTGEIALDVETVHSLAPAAKIILVTTNQTGLLARMNAVRYAASLPGVTAVSMSFGSTETSRSSAALGRHCGTDGAKTGAF
jgi:subtilase family serine protease